MTTNSDRYYAAAEKYYRSGRWGINRLKRFVRDGKLTPAQFLEITGVSYDE